MFERVVEPGDHVIDQGDDGDNFYIIDGYVRRVLVINLIYFKTNNATQPQVWVKIFLLNEVLYSIMFLCFISMVFYWWLFFSTKPFSTYNCKLVANYPAIISTWIKLILQLP